MPDVGSHRVLRAGRVAYELRVEPVREHGLGDGDAVFVLIARKIFGGKFACQRPAPDHAEGEAHPLLVRERDDLDGVFSLYSLLLNSLQNLDAGQHAQRSVEVAAAVHGVYVGPDQDSGSLGITSLAPTEQVPDSVLVNR
jgi:hypothetical protein